MTLSAVLALTLVLTACGSKVDEAASGTVIGTIEESDLGSDESASAAFDLSPGNYVLICNVPRHYEDGMYTGFAVTGGGDLKSTTVNVKLGEWFVFSNSVSVAAGSVTFDVTNEGGKDHNFVVIKSDLAPSALVLQ